MTGDEWADLKRQIDERQAAFIQENKALETAYLKGDVRSFVSGQLKRLREEMGVEEEAEDGSGDDDHEALVQQLLNGGWPSGGVAPPPTS